MRQSGAPPETDAWLLIAHEVFVVIDIYYTRALPCSARLRYSQRIQGDLVAISERAMRSIFRESSRRTCIHSGGYRGKRRRRLCIPQSQLVSIQNVSLSVGEEGRQRKILDNIHFSLSPGELHMVVGPNGCGKVTDWACASCLFPWSSLPLTASWMCSPPCSGSLAALQHATRGPSKWCVTRLSALPAWMPSVPPGMFPAVGHPSPHHQPTARGSGQLTVCRTGRAPSFSKTLTTRSSCPQRQQRWHWGPAHSA